LKEADAVGDGLLEFGYPNYILSKMPSVLSHDGERPYRQERAENRQAAVEGVHETYSEGHSMLVWVGVRG